MRVTLAACVLYAASARVIDLEADMGALADQDDSDTWAKNKDALHSALSSLQPGDTLLIPNKTYHLMGGIRVDNVKGATIRLDGTLSYATDIKAWPTEDGSKDVLECFYGENWEDVTFTSSGVGTMDGRGAAWWGIPGVGYLELGENRPRLMSLYKGKRLLFENILFKDSPYWTFYLNKVDGLEVRHCEINAKRDHSKTSHDILELSAFNTDGFDVTGRNVWIHDCKIWCQDDCIAAKDGSEDMLFERIEASGLGMTIGSIGGSNVRNITFRDIYMKNTVKGIYSKFRGGAGVIQDVTFENFYMDSPSQYAIWIGPAQQSDSSNPCAAHPCSLCWPQTPFSKCDGVDEAKYINIKLKNITVDNAKGSPGLVLAGSQNPMQGVVFEDVRFNNPGTSPWDDFYYCKNVGDAVARGNTWPVPPCFKDETGTCQGTSECTEKGRTCCDGFKHSTHNCASGSRCGCIADGSCATYEEDCCSGEGHTTGWCSAGIGYRCDSASNTTLV